MSEIALPAARSDAEQRLFSWQVRTFWLLWTAYASYYMCRVNFSVAQAAILRDFPGWTMADIGAIPSTYAAVYAVGQFVNGQLAVRVGTRRMMTTALLAAGAANIAFSQVGSFGAMLLVWGINGWAQSAGWSLVVATMAAWTPARRRGLVIGLISTCYTIGNVLAWLLAGHLAQNYSWRLAFLVPGLLLLPVAIVFGVFLRNRPEDAGFAPVRDDEHLHVSADGTSAVAGDTPGLARVLAMTLSNRVLWVLTLGFFCANAVRYAFMNWSVQYMATFQGQSLASGAFKAVTLPLIGATGALFAGWASDAIFKGRRAPLCALMLVGLSVVCVVFAYLPGGNWLAAMALLGLAGFLIYGPDVLMSGVATIDFSHPRAAAAGTGLTMSAGAAGAIFSGAGMGWLLDRAQGDWSLAFFVLAGLALVPALLMVSIWNARPKGAK